MIFEAEEPDIIKRILNNLDITRARARHEVDHTGGDPPQLDFFA